MKKQAILLAHFGTSHADTREKTIGAVERDVRAAFPDWEVRGAFTSGMILRILKKQGISLQSVPEALESLLAEGFERVVIQPTHMICGEEYDKLRAQAEPFREKFAAFSMGLPLRKSAGSTIKSFPGKMGKPWSSWATAPPTLPTQCIRP